MSCRPHEHAAQDPAKCQGHDVVARERVRAAACPHGERQLGQHTYRTDED